MSSSINSRAFCTHAPSCTASACCGAAETVCREAGSWCRATERVCCREFYRCRREAETAAGPQGLAADAACGFTGWPGAAASTFGDVARAACSEAGTKNVSSGGSAVHSLKFLSCALQLNAYMHIHIYKALAQLLLFPWVRTSIMPNEISWLL